MGDMVDHLFPFLRYVRSILLKNNWPSKNRIKNIKVPVLFMMSILYKYNIIGDSDELVPYKHMQDLYELATNAKFKQKVRKIY